MKLRQILRAVVIVGVSFWIASCGSNVEKDVITHTVQTKAATATVNWVACAAEDQVCRFSGTTSVRFGLNGTYATRTATDSIACTVQVFGDPLFGVDKVCEYDAGATPVPPATTWTRCAVEDATCVFSGSRSVRYGANGAYAYQTATGSIQCSNAVFGDPAFGADKTCDYGDAGTPPPANDWTACALEDMLCSFSGTRQVRFGANGSYFTRIVSGPIKCSVTVFADPLYGVDKSCDYRAVPAGAAPTAWSDVIPFPIVPVAAANLPNGKILTWSAYSPTTFGGDNGMTYSAIFDPATQASATRVVTETGHDMFCPGTSLLADGRLLVNGGSSSAKTSIYDFASNSWTVAAPMKIPRGYQGNATLSNGSVLTLGGSWSGGIGSKEGEIWTPGGAWRLMAGIPADPFIGPDPAGVYRGDNHVWLFAQGGGRVFHAGPSANMKWIDTTGSGTVTSAGKRGDDVYSMNGNAVMYDIGKILKSGGSQAYEGADTSAAAYLIDIASGTAAVRKIAPMNYPRAMHNSVVLPTGQVVITGGQTHVKIFSDDRSVLMAELWDPTTEKFTTLSPMAVPRNYHSFSLLLPDARVLVGGGGLCDFNCTTNHLDAQILTPPYLTNADGSPAARPALVSAPVNATYGAALSVTTDSAVTGFSLMRLSSATHSLNNDQRRVPLQFSVTSATRYTLQIPQDPGIVIPGYYMLFAMNAKGVPSVAKTIQIR